jgi:hypothetical protein
MSRRCKTCGDPAVIGNYCEDCDETGGIPYVRPVSKCRDCGMCVLACPCRVVSGMKR